MKVRKEPAEEILKFDDGPIQLYMNQEEGKLTISANSFEFFTNELKMDEEYRLLICMRLRDVEIECKILE